MVRFATLAAAALVTVAVPTTATQIYSTSYDGPNGDGQASGGSYNYWDLNYTGSGSTTTDGAALSGGQGDLTDGVVASNFWYLTENGAGTGPYVGWYVARTANPVLTFHFSGSPTINDIKVHIDNSYVGGVYSPASVLVDGVSRSFSIPAAGSLGWLDIAGLGLSGGSHTIEFDQQGGGWVFASEVEFFGGTVPEPASWAMLIAGFGLVGAVSRRRRMLAV